MHPELFFIQIPYTNIVLPVRSYGTFVLTGLFAGSILSIYRAKKRNLDGEIMLIFLIFTILAGFFGARAMFFIIHWRLFLSSPLYMIKNPGMTIYGGIIAGTIQAVLFVKYLWNPRFSNGKRLKLWQIGDICAPGIALGESFGRIGCFLGGCCYGKPTSLPWAVSYTLEIPGTSFSHDFVSIHPTQIYHSISAFLIFGALLIFERKRKKRGGMDGKTFMLFLLLYSIFRFIIESFRGDDRGPLIAGCISVTQIISLLTAITVIVLPNIPFPRRASES